MLRIYNAEVNRCAKCGACTTVCPVFQATGREHLSARGRLHLLDRLPSSSHSANFADILSKCLLCGACSAECPREIDIPALIIEARGCLPGLSGPNGFLKYLVRKSLAHPGLLSGIASAGRAGGRALSERLPPDSGLRLRLALFGGPHLSPDPSGACAPVNGGKEDKDRPEIMYFSGCLARHLSPEIGRATEKLLKAGGRRMSAPPAQNCCGLAAMAAGRLDEARRLAAKNIAAFKHNDRPILTSCASCYAHLLTYPDLLTHDKALHEQALVFAARVREFSTFFLEIRQDFSCGEATPSGPLKRVLYHDPCHLRFGPGITSAPRSLIKKLPGVELAELPHGPRCCGHGGLFNIGNPELSGDILRRLVQDFAALDTGTVLTTCSGCLLQWRQGLMAGNVRAEAKHLGVLLAECLNP